MIGRSCPIIIASASAALYQAVLPLNPANALPILAAELIKAYSTSDRPCGPALVGNARM